MARHRLAFAKITGRQADKVGLVTDHRRDKEFLIDGRQKCAPQLCVVERRMQMIEREDRVPSKWINHLDQHVRRPLQHRA